MKCSFDQDDIRAMATALDGAWNYLRCRESLLSQPGKARSTRLMLATRIITAAVHDEHRQYGELLLSALKGLAPSADFEPPVGVAHRGSRPGRIATRPPI
jgi:hypothetical protein